MAKIKFGAMMVDARGKLGGHVFSKNRGGAYIRTKVTPSNPRTADQQANRALLGSLSQSWNGLNASEILSWNDAVQDWKKFNIFGDSVVLSGKSLYIKVNKILSQAGYSTIATPPAKGETPIVGFTAADFVISTGRLGLDFSGDLTGTTIQLRATPTLSNGVSNAKNKFRVIGYFDGADYAPEDGYNAYVSKFGVPSVGANIQVEMLVILPSGQMSVPEKVKATVVAS